MGNIAYKYNRFLIALIVFAPFVAYFTANVIDKGFVRVVQLLSFLGVILILVFKTEKRPIKIPNYLIFYFLFTLYVFYSSFIQLDRDFKLVYLLANRLIGGLTLMFIIENLPITKKQYKFIITWSKYILIVAIIVIGLQQVFDQTIYLNTDMYKEGEKPGNETRLHSIYSWIGFISNGVAFVPIFILVVEHLYINKKKVVLWIIAGILYSLLTKGRWIMVNALLVFVILIVNHKNKGKQIFKYLFISPIIILATYFTLNVVGIDTKGILEDRVLEKSREKSTASTRILAFYAFNQLYWDNPIFGVGSIKYGMGSTGKQDYKLKSALGGHSSQIHVGYLSVLYMYGIIGALLFYIFLYLLLKKLYKNAKRTRIWAPFLGILGLALANLTLVTFSIFEMGFIIVLVADKYYSQQKMVKKKINA